MTEDNHRMIEGVEAETKRVKNTSDLDYQRTKKIVIVSSIVALIAAIGVFYVILVVLNPEPSDEALRSALAETSIVQNGVLPGYYVNDSSYEITSFKTSEKSYDSDSNLVLFYKFPKKLGETI